MNKEPDFITFNRREINYLNGIWAKVKSEDNDLPLMNHGYYYNVAKLIDWIDYKVENT